MNLKSLALIGFDEEVFKLLDLPVAWKVNHSIVEPNLVISQLLSWGSSRLHLIKEWGSKVIVIPKISYIHDHSFRSFIESLDNLSFAYLEEDSFLNFAIQANETLGWEFQELNGSGFQSYNLREISLNQVMSEEPGKKELCLDWVNAKGKGYCYVILNLTSPQLTKREVHGNYLSTSKGTLLPSANYNRLMKEWVGEGDLHLEVVSLSLHDSMRLIDRLSHSYLSKFFRKVTWRMNPIEGPHESVDLRHVSDLTDKVLDELIYFTVEKDVKSKLKVITKVKVIKSFKVKEKGKVLDVWGIRLLEGTLSKGDILWLEWISFKISNITIKGIEVEVAKQGDEVGILFETCYLNDSTVKLNDILLRYEDVSLILSLTDDNPEKG